MTSHAGRRGFSRNDLEPIASVAPAGACFEHAGQPAQRPLRRPPSRMRKTPLKRFTRSVVAAMFACTFAAQPAFADGSDPAAVVPVSGTSALPAGCGLPEGDGYVLNPNTEVQPKLAQDPKRPGHLVAVYQQDRWNRYGSNGAVAAVSDDYGATWRPSAEQPAFSRCDGGTAANSGDYDITTDHWVTITPSGAAETTTNTQTQTNKKTTKQNTQTKDSSRHWD